MVQIGYLGESKETQMWKTPHPVDKTLQEPFGCVYTSSHLLLILNKRETEK